VITGLELGADDYVVKPFSPKVLAARVRAALRRVAEAKEGGAAVGRIQRGPLLLDPERHELLLEGERIELSATEFAILELFMRSPGRVFSRGNIIDAVKGPDYPVTDRSVDVQILQLRKKLGEGSELIETVRGVGYRLKD
jgi:two-component system phosphate regulon response regulator PhoB